MKKILYSPGFGLVCWLSLLCISMVGLERKLSDNALVEDIVKQLERYNAALPQEKVYLHFDKPFYTPGDDIWFKLYLRDGLTNAASATSQLVYVELMNPKGNVEKSVSLVVRNGTAAGDFSLDASAPGGTYKIKAYTSWMKNFGEATFFEKEIPVQAVLLPKLRIKLDFERKAYGAADPVVAKLTLANLENKALTNFPFAFTAQLQGKEWKRGTGQTDAEGTAYVTFDLPKQLDSNDGLLNVVFDYQGASESISRSVPIVLNRIDLQFFPEGGELVENVESKVAFKALNEFGKPADIEGVVLDENNQPITTFSSYHQGMGAFSLKPNASKQYRVRITQPAGITRVYSLPPVLSKGYSLSVIPKAGFLRLRISSPIVQPVFLVAQVRGKAYFTKELPATSGETTLDIPIRDFPIGVAQITLFDYKDVARCERLVFVNKQKQLHFEIKTDKEKYLPREKVAMTIRVKDEDGLPAPANLSLSVVDDKLISFADDKQDNILSYLLLSSDLKGKVEEPDFYFNPAKAKADQALDYLLMTQGWRRFEWKEVLGETSNKWHKKIINGAEKAVVRGKLVRYGDKKAVSKAKITVLETEEVTYTDAEGKFVFNDLDLSIPRTLQASTEDGFSRIIQVNDYAQEYLVANEVGGRVVDEQNQPIPGVSVLVKGTNTGVSTDIDGRYRLKLPGPISTPTLIFSYIGYVSEQVEVRSKSVINVTMKADIQSLQEVVVVGYGEQMKEVNDVPAAPRPIRQQRRNQRLEEPEVVFEQAPMAEEEEVPVMAERIAVEEKEPQVEGAPIMAVQWEAQEEEKPVQDADAVFTMVEQMPEFKGGQAKLFKYLKENVQYPNNALEAKIEGRVFVQFLIGADGKVSDVVVLKGIDEACNQEAIRLVSAMPKWQTGKQNGKAVPVRYVLPISFKVDDYLANNPGGLLLQVASQASGMQVQANKYYRSRTFYAPVYASKEPVQTRTDFRQTIYWNPNVEVGKTGETTVSFYNSDEITTFRATLEGISPNGTLGRSSFIYFTQLPFSLDTKVPATLAFEDQVSVPVILKNNTATPLEGKLLVTAPAALTAFTPPPATVKVAANSTTTLHLDYKVASKAGKGTFLIRFESQGLSDAFEQPVEIAPKGFPVVASFSGNELAKTYSFEVKDLVKQSLKARFTAYPNVLNDLMGGIESILQEPYGCFEQTSSSTYPNILALQYMRESGTGDPAVEAKARTLIDKGYQKLVAFETKEKGYEWFGSVPAHEGLTAYGLMEFTDMQEVYASVDKPMLKRTTDWILKRRDGQGGFGQSSTALDQFGAASKEVTNAYIVYALSEAGHTDLEKELAGVYKEAMKSKDAYQLALVANSLLNLRQAEKAQQVLVELLTQINKKGIENVKADHSITRSYGKSLQVETASLMALALLKADKKDLSTLRNIIQFLTGSRENYGGFGSTQATIMALKALTQYAKYSKSTAESGTIEIYIDDQKVATKSYEKGATGEITVTGLEKQLSEGKHRLSVRFVNTTTALPYSMDVRWTTYTPNSQIQCKVGLTTHLAKAKAQVGETVRLTAHLVNKTNEGLPMTMAVVGIPSGLSAQPWQLKELQDKGKIAFYEVQKNYVVFYYRSLAPSVRHEIALDLKAEIPGDYEAPASSAYLYYTNEFKNWSGGERIVIEKK